MARTEQTFGQKHPRHPAEVTGGRLLGAVQRWGGKFTGKEKDMIGMIRRVLAQIAEGER